MPTDERILGFSNRWYEPAIDSTQNIEVVGAPIRLIAPTYFLATKFEAFRGRGNNDYSGSHGLEDVIAVIDGRPEIVQEVQTAPAEPRSYVASAIRRLLGTLAFTDALPGFLLPDSASQERNLLLRERLNALAQADAHKVRPETYPTTTFGTSVWPRVFAVTIVEHPRPSFRTTRLVVRRLGRTRPTSFGVSASRVASLTAAPDVVIMTTCLDMPRLAPAN
jgi:hypothetical protein